MLNCPCTLAKHDEKYGLIKECSSPVSYDDHPCIAVRECIFNSADLNPVIYSR